ncbi:MAG TPA: hypothetical protein VJG32_02910 [Anaerolineae bacterium]|nr:hypothetical protein [Anaerolineae bacterium]
MLRIHASALRLVITIVILVSACVGTRSNSFSLTLNTTNDSGVAGKVVLTDAGAGKTKVEMSISGQPAGVDPATHIHNGTCAEISGVAYRLGHVTEGQSATTLKVALDSLLTGKYLILVHPDTARLFEDVACGDLPAR